MSLKTFLLSLWTVIRTKRVAPCWTAETMQIDNTFFPLLSVFIESVSVTREKPGKRKETTLLSQRQRNISHLRTGRIVFICVATQN